MNQKRFAILFSTLYFSVSVMLLVGCVPGERTGTEVGATSNKTMYQVSMTDRHLFHDQLSLDRAAVVTSGPILQGNWDRVDRFRFQDRRDFPMSNPVAPVLKGSTDMTDRYQFHDRLLAPKPGGSD